jgi:hypothetical protein
VLGEFRTADLALGEAVRLARRIARGHAASVLSNTAGEIAQALDRRDSAMAAYETWPPSVSVLAEAAGGSSIVTLHTAQSGRATRMPVARRIAPTYSGSVVRVTSTTPPESRAWRTRRTPAGSR